jgi:hypothetical protein
MDNPVNKFMGGIDPIDSLVFYNEQCNFIAKSTKHLMQHCNQCHRIAKEFQSPCLFKNCFHQEKFASFSGLK